MKFKETANKIIRAVGGAGNIKRLNYCATRLRFDLNDRELVDMKQLDSIDEIIGKNITSNVFQLIIGADVQNVYQEMNKLLDKNEDSTTVIKDKKKKKGIKEILNGMMDALAASMTPIIPAIYAAGLISAILAIVKAVNPGATATSTFVIMNSIQQAVFYFLPVLVGSSAAKRFGCNQYIGMVLGSILVFSAINGVEGLSFLGIKIPTFTYNSTVLPVIMGVWFMSYVDKFSDRFLPKSLIFFVKPVLALGITLPMTLLIFGPIGAYFGQSFGVLINWIATSVGGWLVPAIKGFTSPLSVLTGTTGIFVPIVIGSITEVGYDPLIMPGSLCANVAVGGACLAIALITRKKQTKQLSITSGTTALLGITEPAIYGVLVNYRIAFLAAMCGGGAGGLIAGLAGIKCYSPIASLIGLPAYIDDSPGFSNLLFAILAAAVAFAVAFGIVYLFRNKILANEEQDPIKKEYNVSAPVKGERLNISEVNDNTFASNVLGKSIAINPSEGVVIAPEDGEVTSLFTTNHAIGLTLNNGIELLIHIGIDTVKLNGKHFTAFVKQGDQIAKGDKLIEFDIESILDEGYDPTVILVITNTENFHEVIEVFDSRTTIFEIKG